MLTNSLEFISLLIKYLWKFEILEFYWKKNGSRRFEWKHEKNTDRLACRCLYWIQVLKWNSLFNNPYYRPLYLTQLNKKKLILISWNRCFIYCN